MENVMLLDYQRPQNIELSCQYSLDLVKKMEREQTRIRKKLFIRYLEKSRGVLTAVCEKSNVPRSTYYKWCETDKEFHSNVLRVLQERGQVIEDRLFTVALKGDVKALTFLIPFLNPKYRKKKEGSRKVHIYHHVGVRPEAQSPISLKDLIDNPALWESYTKWTDSQDKKK